MNSSWKKQLRLAMAAQPARTDHPVKIAILGVGNELAGDDAAGPRVARALQRAQANRRLDRSLLIIDAGLAPEAFGGKLRQFKPNLVIIIDAAHLGVKAGEIAWLHSQEAEGMSASTHTLPLSIFAGYLEQELGCQVALIGIQPLDIEPGRHLSTKVNAALKRLVRGIEKISIASPTSP